MRYKYKHTCTHKANYIDQATLIALTFILNLPLSHTLPLKSLSPILVRKSCAHKGSFTQVVGTSAFLVFFEYSPAHWKSSSHTDHICTMKKGAQQTMYARTITKVILTVLSLALDIVVMLLTEFFPMSPFLVAAPVVPFRFLNLMFFHML